MSARQDFLDALNHKQPRRVPVDFGATAVTGIHVRCVERLRRHYGLHDHPVRVADPYQMLGEVEDDLAAALGVTVRGEMGRISMFGFENRDYKPYKTLWGQTVLVPEGFRTTRAADGSELIHPRGDLSAPPSGRMPAGGYFFDSINRQPPLEEDALDYHDNLAEFGPLAQADIAFLADWAARNAEYDGGRVARVPGAGLGDIAHVPGPGLLCPKGIRDVTEWYVSTVARPDYVHAVFEAQTDIALKNLPILWQTLGDKVDVAFVCGTDFGTQTSQFCARKTFESLYAPYYRRINDWIHAHTNWKTFKHSCGAVEPLIGAFIDAGFDILNPVQISAAGMDPEGLKTKYGADIVFWGGGVDTQRTLPFGTAEEVRAQVLSRCEVLGRDGGFVFNAIHNIQADTPVENVAAMIAALEEFNA